MKTLHSPEGVSLTLIRDYYHPVSQNDTGND